MVQDPKHWAGYFTGSEAELALARKYSLSDRIRYYWPKPAVQHAVGVLIANLTAHPLPMGLVKQFLPAQFERIRDGKIPNQPRHIVWDHIRETIRDYAEACSERTAEMRASGSN
jgi:D-tagatose-1,6-bisphosphate aldolase subunit GatZ/KbaZ